MDVVDLERIHGDFYVPSFQVKVGGRDLVREHKLAITTVSVDLELKTAGRFSFTVANAFDAGRRDFVIGPDREELDLLELFAFGGPVEIAMGYGDPRKLDRMLTGLVTEISTSYPERSAPELTISGYDRAYRLMNNRARRNWNKAKDSTAVTDIAAGGSLKADVAETSDEHARIEQNQESDLDFVRKLADRNGYEFYVRNNTLHFAPPGSGRSEVIKLEWGKGLLSFSPSANLARQVSAVEVHGWDVQTKKPVVGRAERGQEPGRDKQRQSGGRQRQSGGERLSGLLKEQPVLRVRQPVYSQQEANTRARSALKERAEDFLKGDGEALGLPALVPDTNVLLAGLGKVFSKPYYVEQTTHTVNSSGYRTRFKVKEPDL